VSAFVEVTNADFNGSTWDGAPFRGDESVNDWLRPAVREGTIKVVPGDLDYALWEVATPHGPVRALPGDRIERHSDGSLTVTEHPEKYRHPCRLPAVSTAH
jgi:hypothetical protein